MAISFQILIEDSQIINGMEYTQEQLQQGLAQIRSQHNDRTEDNLSDAEWLQWAHLQNLAVWYEQGKGQESVPPSPITPQPNWTELRDRLLGGNLYPIFQRLTIAALEPSANTISTARGDITDAIMVVKIESALAAGIYLLVNIGGYQFTEEERNAWNGAVTELNFSSAVYL